MLQFMHNGNAYTVKLDGDCLTIQKDGKSKTIMVYDSPEFRYQVMKTRINADGGAAGLYRWIEKALVSGFMDTLAKGVIAEAFDNVKAYKPMKLQKAIELLESGKQAAGVAPTLYIIRELEAISQGRQHETICSDTARVLSACGKKLIPAGIGWRIK